MKISKIYLSPKNRKKLFYNNEYYFNKKEKYKILKYNNHKVVNFLKEKKADSFYIEKKFYNNYLFWLTKTLKLSITQIRKELFDQIILAPKSKVLFIGCGFGDEISFFVKKYGSSHKIFAQDISYSMVMESAKKLKKFNIDFSISDVAKLPYKNNFFDLVFHFGGFNQFRYKKKSLEEINRVSKNLGRVILSDEGISPSIRKTELFKALKVNNNLWSSKPPFNIIPKNSRNLEVKWILKENFYMIKYLKIDNKIDINLDVKHRSPKGGTIRSRYENYFKKKLII